MVQLLSVSQVRNGLQIKGQAMTYIQCNFCNSMVDADLYLLQVCMISSMSIILCLIFVHDRCFLKFKPFFLPFPLFIKGPFNCNGWLPVDNSFATFYYDVDNY